MSRISTLCAAAGALTIACSAQAQTPYMEPDIPARFVRPVEAFDYVKREVMIPMRDGVKLHTVIVVPKAAKARPSS